MKYFIYLYLGANNEVIYVGKTINFEKRDASHRREKNWYNEVKEVKVAEVATKADQTMYEIFYINKFKPVYNNKNNYMAIPSVQLPELDFKIFTNELKEKHKKEIKDKENKKIQFLARRGITTETIKRVNYMGQKLSFEQVYDNDTVYFNWYLENKDELVILKPHYNLGVMERDIFKFLLSIIKFNKNKVVIRSSVVEILNYFNMNKIEGNIQRIKEILSRIGFLLIIKTNSSYKYINIFYGVLFNSDENISFMKKEYLTNYNHLLKYLKDLPIPTEMT